MGFPMLRGVPASHTRRHESIVDAVYRHSIGDHRDNEVHCDIGARKAVTYRELWALSSLAKRQLSALGIRPGDHVALVMVTSVDVIAMALAILRLGAVIIPVQPMTRLKGRAETARRILGVVKASRVKLFLAPSADIDTFVESMDGLVVLMRSHEEIMTGDAPEGDVPEHHAGDGNAIIQFSSGSTGTPKGVCLSRENLSENLAAVEERVQWKVEDRVVSWLPFYHDLGLIGVMLSSLWAGCTAYFYSPTEFVRHPMGWLRRLSDLGATMTAAPQFAFTLCLAKAEAGPQQLDDLDLRQVRYMLNGSEFIDWAACSRFEETFGRCGLRRHVVQPAYGLAENCVGVTLRTPGTPVPIREIPRRGEHGAVADSADATRFIVLAGNGTPVQGTEITIRDAEGKELPPGVLGEICIRGTSAAMQYMFADSTTASTHANGWLPTGDIGTLVDDELFVAGRTKEIFKRGGRTFAPTDIENVLGSALGLEPGGVAAFAFQDPETRADKLAVIIEVKKGVLAEPPQAFAEDVKRLTLREFQFQTDCVYLIAKGQLPRTSSGKIRRAYLSSLANDQCLMTAMPLLSLN